MKRMTKGAANSLAQMQELIAKGPRNGERIFPYIGGEEVNDEPDSIGITATQSIFSIEHLEEAEKWPDLVKIVESKGQAGAG